MKRSIVISCLVAVGAFGCGSANSGTSTSATSSSTESSVSTSGTEAGSFAQISVADVAAGIEGPDRRLAVYDANHRETFDEHHVPGATWVDYHTMARAELPEDASTPLVFYCYNEQCEASHRAAEGAVALGFSDVSVMGAGIAGWVEAGQPVEGAGPAPETATATQ